MSLFFDSVQRASWAGFEFPVSEISIVGAGRLFVHEYPHADGGNLEPLGRKPYIIRMHMQFDEGNFNYPGNYPTTLDSIRFVAESGQSAKLVIPNVGSIQAFCPMWQQKWTSARRSGEDAEYEWIEDQSATLKQVFFTGIASAASMQQSSSDLESFKPKLDALGVDPSLLDKVLAGVNDVLAIRDQADLTAAIASAKIESLVTALDNLDTAITTPVGYDVLESLRRVWGATNDFATNVANNATPLSTYLVPMQMSIMDISRNIFGDTSRATDILSWNVIDDAFAVPAGQQLRYLPDAA